MSIINLITVFEEPSAESVFLMTLYLDTDEYPMLLAIFRLYFVEFINDLFSDSGIRCKRLHFLAELFDRDLPINSVRNIGPKALEVLASDLRHASKHHPIVWGDGWSLSQVILRCRVLMEYFM